ncbi:hypothetical protein [Saccharothrix sp.]|uniref:hypothetical protein n=1 Tax=Saccharothrix sp. TaxID=1873460 RepID=UPI0035C85A83
MITALAIHHAVIGRVRSPPTRLRYRPFTPHTIARIAASTGASSQSQRLGRHRWVVERAIYWLTGYRRLTIPRDELETGGLAVTTRPYRVVDTHGRPHPARFGYGIPT